MSPTPSAPERLLSKVPEATLVFWLVKVCATTVGETGGDAFSMSLKLGYALSTGIFLAFFVVALAAQLAVKRYRPWTYWLVVVATTTVGTTTSDFLDRTAGLGYGKSTAAELAAVIAVLVVWRVATGRIAVDHITDRKNETFYWITILVSNTLGTALGDFSSDFLPDLMVRLTHAPDGSWGAWGFELGAVVFAGLILIVAALHWLRALPQAILFWAAYVLTRPLGATLGDTLTKPVAQGGLNLNRFVASGVIGLAMVVILTASRWRRRPSEPPSATG